MPAAGVYHDVPFCQDCLDGITAENAKLITAERPYTPEPHGKEPNQEPIQLAPIPAYEYPSVPVVGRPPGTPLPVQRVRDPERVTVPELPERSARKPEREKALVSHSPTRTRTQPFLPARRDPIQSAPVIL